MSTTLYLELYNTDIPGFLATLPGADGFDKTLTGIYWAVLLNEEMLDTPDPSVRPFLAPAAIGNGGFTNGTDVIPGARADYRPTSVGAWRPERPPYAFRVTAPNGQTINIDPQNGGSPDSVEDESIELAGNGIGIWTVQVISQNDAALPIQIGSLNAVLNPDPTMWPAGLSTFLQQPLLILEGPTVHKLDCAEPSLVVTGGCAPGNVTLRADISGDASSIIEMQWHFGDGSSEAMDLANIPTFPVTKTHNYTGPPADSAKVKLKLRRTCEDEVVSSSANIPACEQPGTGRDREIPTGERLLTCPEITSVRAISGCAPGAVTFELKFNGFSADIESIVWTFEEGTPQQAVKVQPPLLLQPTARIEHAFTTSPTQQVKVVLRRRQGCNPLEVTAFADVPVCGQCPELVGIAPPQGCAPGEVTLKAEGTNLELATRIEWDFGDQSAPETGAEVTHHYAQAQEFEAKVTVFRPPGCDPIRQDKTVRVPACSDSSDGNRDDGGTMPPQSTVSFVICAFVLFIALLLIFLGSVAMTVGFCSMSNTSATTSEQSSTDTTGEGSSTSSEQQEETGGTSGNTGAAIVAFIGAVLLLLGALLFLIWLFTCGTMPGHCPLLQLAFLFFLYVVPLLGALGVAMAQSGTSATCLMGILIDVLTIGGLAAITFTVMTSVGCQPVNPFQLVRPVAMARRRLR